jgi:hypothetical protein
MRAFIRTRDTLLNRALLLLLIASAAEVGALVLLQRVGEAAENRSMVDAFQPWTPPGILLMVCVFSLLLAVYSSHSSPHQPRRVVRSLTILAAGCIAFHVISMVWDLALVAHGLALVNGGMGALPPSSGRSIHGWVNPDKPCSPRAQRISAHLAPGLIVLLTGKLRQGRRRTYARVARDAG